MEQRVWIARGAALVCALSAAIQVASLWLPAHRVGLSGGWGCGENRGPCSERVEVHTTISHTSTELAVLLGTVAVAALAIYVARRSSRRCIVAGWLTFVALLLVDLLLVRELLFVHVFLSPTTLIGEHVGAIATIISFGSGLTMALARRAPAPVAGLARKRVVREPRHGSVAS